MPVRKRRTTTTRRRTLRGRGVWSWIKDKAKSLWNSNKGRVQAEALRLANLAKDRALQYAREKKLLSSAVNKILPKHYGIDKNVSSYVASQTGMGLLRPIRFISGVRPRLDDYINNGIQNRRGLGKRKRVGRPKKVGRPRGSGLKGRGIFGDIWSGVKNVGGLIAKPVTDYAVKQIIGGRRKRRTTTRRRKLVGRGVFGNILGSMLPF